MTIHPFEEDHEEENEEGNEGKVELPKKKEENIYSQYGGIAYGLLFGILLWWIPIAGPSVAGYLCGRKSGKPSTALVSSLVSTAVIVLITLALIPWTSGLLGIASTYFRTGVLHLSGSGLIVNGVLGSIYSSYAAIRSLAIILPGSLLLLNIFSLVGGAQSELKVSEKAMSVIYAKKRMASSFRKAPKVRLEGKHLREYRDGQLEAEDDEETSKGWTYL